MCKIIKVDFKRREILAERISYPNALPMITWDLDNKLNAI